jgi:hypothetical protein
MDLKETIAKLDALWRKQNCMAIMNGSTGYLLELLELRESLGLPDIWRDDE